MSDTQRKSILVVDLDGSLLRSDMLLETFWSAIASRWTSALSAVASIFSGKASLKRELAKVSNFDPALLPYNEDVLDYIREWRRVGGAIALVTASDQMVADRIAAHLGTFDYVHGSDGKINLKGEKKAKFLEEKFGRKNFSYVGDARADLPIWDIASSVISVGAGRRLQRGLDGRYPSVKHLSPKTISLGKYLRAVRPHQWVKNVLVFLPILAAHELGGHAILVSLAAFVSFSLIASSIYLLNDQVDLSSDRAHPRKRFRPLASGELPLLHGSFMCVGLIAIGFGIAAAVGPNFIFVICAYLALNGLYSFGLKRRMVIDIMMLAGLYTIRIFAGSTATGIPVSEWLLAFSMFIFLSLAAVKRQAELVDLRDRGELEVNGRGYSVSDIPMISGIAISAGYLSVLVSALYVSSPEISSLYRAPELLWGVSVVLLYWVTRTVMVAHRGAMTDDPIIFAAKDRVSQACLALIGALLLGGVIL